jgi:uncharacterized protein
MKNWLAVVFLACSVLATAPAHVHADEKSHRAAVLELFSLMDMNHVLSESTEAMLAAQIEGNPALAPFAPKFRQFFAKYLSWETLRDDLVGIYSKAFTEPEVKQLVAFYKTPIGKKALQQMPKLMQQGAQIGAERVQKHMPELMQMLQEQQEDQPKRQPSK